MKENGNNLKVGEYYIGLDLGINNVGWAVTDTNYNLCKFHGKEMWGVRLFDSANTSKERRINRGNRRRLNRRNQRLKTLELFFNDEIAKIDPLFLRRLEDSGLWREDKSDNSCKYSLFNDSNYTDVDYFKPDQYPTIYHLRSALLHKEAKKDPRLVYLAIHHILKNRGHFLYDINEDIPTLDAVFTNFELVLSDFEITFEPSNRDKFLDALIKKSTKEEKYKELQNCYGKINNEVSDSEELSLSIMELLKLLSGKSIELSKLFIDENLKNAELKNISLEKNIDDIYEQLFDMLDDRVSIIRSAKEVYDAAILSVLKGNYEYISDAKKKQYDDFKSELRFLKDYIKSKNDKSLYDKVFNRQIEKKDKLLPNFYAYSNGSNCSQKEFCEYLKKIILKDEIENSDKKEDDPNKVIYDSNVTEMLQKIKNSTYLTKLRNTDNSCIPYQYNLSELKIILENYHFDFYDIKDSDGISVKDKIISLFTFKIPYYVGPLNNKSSRANVVRTATPIYPWNFEKTVDKEQSAMNFINNLVGRCKYTHEKVLPKNSLLYSEFLVLNEINKIKIDGSNIGVKEKNELYTDLFINSYKTVTEKQIASWLKAKGYCSKTAKVLLCKGEGEHKVKTKLTSYHDFKDILKKTNNDTEMVENIIERILVYGSDKKMLETWLRKNTHDLDESDIKKILKLKYSGWGTLSKKFLTEIYHVDNETGQTFSILDMLHNTNFNHMELLGNNFTFIDKINEIEASFLMEKNTLDDQLEALYVSPSVKRSIIQALKIIDEIIDIKKASPKKVFIEMARDLGEENKGKLTKTRKDKLLDLYKSCKNEIQNLEQCGFLEEQTYDNMLKKLNDEENDRLNSKKVFLYYIQFGHCMYTNEKIELSDLLSNSKNSYDIDHIIPRSKKRDNSFDNLVLVKGKANKAKGDIYPISEEIQSKMIIYWKMLLDKKLISQEKFNRLTRKNELTSDELKSFVSAQLVETRQSTKALATILKSILPMESKIIYSKARNVSDFRNKYGIQKFRDVNDYHHAKDAYLNIVVGNVYYSKFTEKFWANIKNEKYSLNAMFDWNINDAWVAPTKEEIEKQKEDRKNNAFGPYELSGTFTTVYKYIYKNNPIISIKPYERKGALFDICPLKKGKGKRNLKSGKDISKYGGYNNANGSYFCILKYKKKSKEVISILPVYATNKKGYKNNPIKYFKEEFGIDAPEILDKKLLMKSTMEINGARLCITGRSEDNLLFMHTYQLAISDSIASYLKQAQKYVEKCLTAKMQIPSKIINKEMNAKIYDLFLSKLECPSYNKLFSKEHSTLMDAKSEFLELNEMEQARILLEIFKIFKCDRTLCDLKEKTVNKIKLRGIGKYGLGNIRYSKNISNWESVYIVNQSVTGLYEKKIKII